MDSPTLEELRNSLRYGDHSRFHKLRCPKCGEMVTNQAMGRKSHMRMHEREKIAIDFPCPKCGAPAGHPCATFSFMTTPPPMKGFHKERVFQRGLEAEQNG
jgi:predicted RNA-binding Zn-ribbon protein involved in translation (DUF1610 family)